MKKALIFFIILTALILTFTLTVSAEDVIQSGTWGDLTWELNETTGELVISGVGEMDDLTNDDAWRPFCGKIKSVKVSSGITSIGANAFMGCNMVTSVVLPDSLLKIGSNAFSKSSYLIKISIPGSVEEIGNFCFFRFVRF